MNPSPPDPQTPPGTVWYGWVLNLFHHLKVGESQVTFMWAVLVGIVGASMSMCFEWLVEFIQWLLTGIWSDSRVGVFSLLEPEWRIAVPAIGGLVAGFILLFVKRRMPGQAMEYMEALAIGNGLIKVRASSLKVLSAAWSIASGAAIGKEGPIIQSSALIASAVGQKLHVSIPRLRLLVGCGAAAGFTTAFHAPFSGCLFVSEIIIGTVSMDILAPLLIASCTGFLMLHLLGDPSPLYSSPFESFTMFSQSLWCVALGVLAAVAAKGWVALLDVSNKYLNGRQSLLPVRLMAAGLLVGVLACFYPEVVGNGQALITGLVHEDYGTQQALILLAVKVSAVAVVFGCGTGNPFFSTDTTTALRAVEVSADIMFKATMVDGVYDKDPHKYPDAKKYDTLTFTKVLEDRLAVMDGTAATLCRDNKLPILVFDLADPDNIAKAVQGENVGTLVYEG